MKNFLNKCIFLLLFLFCSTIINTNAEEKAEATKSSTPIFIDSRLLVLAHPLFKAFDPKSKRFKGTSSESFEENFEAREAFVQKIKDTEDELLKSPEKLKETLKGIPFKDKMNAEREFILEKKLKESKLENMKRRAYLSRLVSTKDGMTPYMSIYPQCSDLANAIKNVINILKIKYKTEIVIDIANILPLKEKTNIKQRILITNLVKDAYQKERKASEEDFSNWIEAANSYWASKLGMNADIIPVGVKDVRLEAIKLMEEEGKGYQLWNWQE